MRRDDHGNNIFENLSEAVWAQRNWSLKLQRWLHQCVEQGDSLPSLPHFRSLINDWANVTTRYLLSQHDRIAYLQDKVRDLSEELDTLRARTSPEEPPARPLPEMGRRE